MEFGGTRLYIGGSNEFQEYVSGYYDVRSMMTSCEMYAISNENLDTKLKVDQEIEDHEKLSQPKKVCVIKADTPILYNLLPSLLDGSIFGPKNEIIVYLYDDHRKMFDVERDSDGGGGHGLSSGEGCRGDEQRNRHRQRRRLCPHVW